MGKMTVNSDRNTDQLSQIYGEMNETGKEKLKEISDQILKIWKTVNEEKLKFEIFVGSK
jgi:ABC-type enterochelin transport system substrate-binding protein